MKTAIFTVICLLVIITTIGICRSDSGHRNQSAASEDNNSMAKKDHLPPNVRVRLQKSGGLVPIEREWLFYPDGKIRHPNGKITKLEKKIFQRILGTKEIDPLADLYPDFPPPAGSADFETIELTVRGSAGIFKIRVADSSESVPEKLWDFLDALEEAAKRSLADSIKK